MYTHMYIYIYIYIHTHTCTCMYMCVYMYMCMYVYVLFDCYFIRRLARRRRVLRASHQPHAGGRETVLYYVIL